MTGEILTSPRLRLRPVNESDIPVLYEWYSDSTIMSLYDGIHFYAKDLETFGEEYKLWLEHEVALDLAGSFIMELADTGEPVGECTWSEVERSGPDSPGIFQVGGLVGAKNLHRKGLGTEALTLLRDFLFTNKNAHRLEAVTRAFNKGAMKTLNRNGFAREGVLRESVLVDGVWQDRVMFSLLRQDWESGPDSTRPASID